MNIYVKIEILERELEGRLLLAMTAAERGHDVLLGTMSALLSHRFWLAPGLYHDKSVSPKPAKVDLHRRLREAGFAVTSQDEEHGLSEADYAPFVQRRFSDRTLSQASRVMTWGPHDTASLLEQHPRHASVITMTGSPRVDIWRPELAEVQSRGQLPIIDPLRPYVLFATSALPFQPNPFWQVIESTRPTQFPDGRDDPREWRHYTKYAVAYAYVARLVRAIRIAAERLPDVQFVVRPHPTAVVEAWHVALGAVPGNVFVLSEGGSGRWISRAAAVIHNGSTAGVEAAARGVPVISFQPNGERRDMFTNRVGRVAGDEEELVGLLDDVLSGDTAGWEQDAQAILAERFAALDGRLAADRIVDAWEELHEDGLSGRNRPRLARRLAVTHRGIGRARAAMRGAGSTRSRRSELDVSGKFPPLDGRRLHDLSRAISESLSRFDDIRAVRVGPDLVHLFRRDR